MHHLTPDQALTRLHSGHCTQRDYNRFMFAWGWSAVRFSSLGNWAARQDRYYEKYGRNAMYARINRVRRVLGFDAI